MTAKAKPYFFWSLPQEGAFPAALRARYPDVCVVPMHAECLDTVRSLFREEEWIDPSSAFAPGELAELDAAVIRFENDFRERLRRCGQPWLASMCYDTVRTVCYATFRLWRLLGILSARLDYYRAEIQPAFSQIHQSFHRRVEQFMLRTTIADLHTTAWETPRQRRIRKNSLRFKRRMGRLVNRHAGRWMRRVVEQPMPSGRCDVLVAGLLRTDVHAQRTLVRRLREEVEGPVTWYVYGGGSLAMAKDEVRSSDALPDHVPVTSLDQFAWRWPIAGTWSRADLVAQAETLMAGMTFPSTFLPPHAGRLLASALVEFHPDLRCHYASIAALMEAGSPRLVVTDCNVGTMAFVREWARAHGVPYIKLPHGFEYEETTRYEWDNARTGVLGAWLEQRIQRDQPECPTYRAGGVHLAEQAEGLSVDEATLAGSTRVLLLASELLRTDFPDTLEQQAQDLRDLMAALHAGGRMLGIRCHPRSAYGWFYRKVVDASCAAGAPAEMLDALASLRDQVLASGAAMIRIASSSAIVALYARLPLIGWVPRPGHPASDAFLRGLPLHASTAAEVASLAERVGRDPDFRRDVLCRQDAYLNELVTEPQDDPFARSLAVIREALSPAQPS